MSVVQKAEMKGEIQLFAVNKTLTLSIKTQKCY